MDWAAYDKIVEKMEKVVKQGARLNFETYGNVKPVAFVLVTRDLRTGDKIPPTVVLAPLDLSSEEAKDATADTLRRFTAATEAIAIAIATEIWYARYPGATKEDLPFLPRPIERPDRKEYVMVQVETLMGARSFLAEIVRRPDGSGVLGPWKLDEFGYSGGRMTGFIKPIPVGEA